MMIAANIISMTILFAVPLLLVAMGGMFSEHSGVINIALEGMMIIGALFACFTLQGLDQSGFGPAHPQLSMFIAILVAGVTGMIFSLLLGFAAINLKADQTIGGTALNQFAPAFAVVMTWAIQGQGLTTIFIPNWVRITRDTFGLAPELGQHAGHIDALAAQHAVLAPGAVDVAHLQLTVQPHDIVNGRVECHCVDHCSVSFTSVSCLYFGSGQRFVRITPL